MPGPAPISDEDKQDAVLHLLQTRNLALKNLSFKHWSGLYKELEDPSLLRREKAQMLRWKQYKASYKAAPNGKVQLRVKKVPDFDQKHYDYLTPASYSLMPTWGRIEPYGSGTIDDDDRYLSINTGILVNIHKCKTKPHIYEGDGQTGSYLNRRWDVEYMWMWEDEARKEIQEKMQLDPSLPEPSFEEVLKEVIEKNSDMLNLRPALEDRKRHLSLDELREKTTENKPYHYNEIMLSAQRSAIAGVYAYHFPQSQSRPVRLNCNLASRLDALYNQHKLANDLKVHVPIYIVDPVHGLSLYSLAQQRADHEQLKAMNQEQVLCYLSEPVRSFAQDYINSPATVDAIQENKQDEAPDLNVNVRVRGIART